MKKTLLGMCSVSLFLLAGLPATAQEADGEKLYTELGCVYCHGPEGREPPLDEYPKLAGQSEEYLVQQILDIKNRERGNGYTGMMQPAVLSVTQEQIEAISAWLASLPD